MSEPRAYDEKRDFIRMRVSTPITIDVAGQQFEAVCRNLSGSGLLVESDGGLDAGTSVEVCIKPGDSHSDFRASATVNRVDSEGGRYLIGLSISAIHD